MDSELIKLIGGGGSQIILTAGYIPMAWLIRVLWSDRAALGDKILAILTQQFADAEKRKDLWDAQAKVIDGQTGAIKDLTREVQAARSDIQRIRP